MTVNTFAFDVYGTLVDTSGVVELLTDMVGEKAQQFSDNWRNKQLEYSFRRGLMKDYVKFSECTRQALDFTCQSVGQDLTTQQKNDLLSKYNSLPAFQDALEALSRLQSQGHHCFAFSNGDPESVDQVLRAAGIRNFFKAIISVDDVKTFKPNPEVYRYFLKQTGADANNTWLISSNPFDVLGGLNAGMKTAWVKRSDKMVFDPWDATPTITISTLTDFSHHLEELSR